MFVLSASRRGPSAGILYGAVVVFLTLGVFTLASPLVGVFLILATMSVIGVHGMLTGTASMDFGGSKNAGVAVGLIDGMVYLGFAAQSLLLGYVLPKGDAAADPRAWGWWLPVILPMALLGFVLSLRIWNATAKPAASPAKDTAPPVPMGALESAGD